MWQGAHDHGIQRVLHIPHHPKLPACPLEAAAWEWLRIRRISSPHHVWWLLLCQLGYTELLYQNFFSTMFLKWTTRNILSQSWKKHFCLIHTSSVMWPSTNPGSAMKGTCRYCQRPPPPVDFKLIKGILFWVGLIQSIGIPFSRAWPFLSIETPTCEDISAHVLGIPVCLLFSLLSCLS